MLQSMSGRFDLHERNTTRKDQISNIVRWCFVARLRRKQICRDREKLYFGESEKTDDQESIANYAIDNDGKRKK